MSFLKLFDKMKQKKAGCTAVIVAAGSSRRMGADKLFLPMAGIPVIVRTLLQFQACESVDEIIIVTREDKLVEIADYCKKFGITKATKILQGGKERAESSAAGVFEADRHSGYIAISDGARPLVSPALITATIDAARKYGAAAPAVPVKDTIKVAVNGVVTETPDRSQLFAIQTPQVFEADLIKGALTKAIQEKLPITDDCSAVEAMGYPVHLVEGSYRNIKITTQEDMIVCEAYLSEMRGDV